MQKPLQNCIENFRHVLFLLRKQIEAISKTSQKRPQRIDNIVQYMWDR